MSRLYQIQEQVRRRTDEIAAAHWDWPCRKACDECCRSLAAVPLVSEAEWRAIGEAIAALPATLAEMVRARIRESAGMTRPVVCPLLDVDGGLCLIYEARPVACRAYGFYAGREGVRGCSRIEAVSREAPDVIWGNHAALEASLGALGRAAELHVWLALSESAKRAAAAESSC